MPMPTLDTASFIQLVAGGILSFFMWTTRRTVGETDRKMDLLMNHRDASLVTLATLEVRVAALERGNRHQTGEYATVNR